MHDRLEAPPGACQWTCQWTCQWACQWTCQWACQGMVRCLAQLEAACDAASSTSRASTVALAAACSCVSEAYRETRHAGGSRGRGEGLDRPRVLVSLARKLALIASAVICVCRTMTCGGGGGTAAVRLPSPAGSARTNYTVGGARAMSMYDPAGGCPLLVLVCSHPLHCGGCPGHVMRAPVRLWDGRCCPLRGASRGGPNVPPPYRRTPVSLSLSP